MRSNLRHASKENTSHRVDQTLTQSVCGHHLVSRLKFQRVSANRTITTTTIDAGEDHLRRCRCEQYDTWLMVEIARQFATASCLLQFSMPSENRFLSCNIKLDMINQIRVDLPLNANCTSTVRHFRADNQPDDLSINVTFEQSDQIVCEVNFTLVPHREKHVDKPRLNRQVNTRDNTLVTTKRNRKGNTPGKERMPPALTPQLV